MSYSINVISHLMHKSARVACATAIAIAPMVSAAEARVKVGVTAAVIPQAVMGDQSERLKTVTVGAKVDQDVLIETGKRGRTQVLFVDGSSMNIGPSSRIVIDEFVFDPGQLDGNLGAKIEKGSMRFIGGVLSKRAGQVKFNAGEATVGIRGGIAKIAVEADGKMLAQLVHGKISIQTPEGVFETDRIGTQIERAPDGAVATSTVTAEDAKTELDQEAKENEEEVPADNAGAPSPTDEAADVPPADTEEKSGDVLVDNPVESGLVEVDAEGNLKATEELAEIDPDAAKLIDEGALVVTEDGEIAPTAKILELDETAQKMFEEGLLKIDENGLLVPNEEFAEDTFFNADAFSEAEDKTVSEETLADFGLTAPAALTREDSYKNNLQMTRLTLKEDPTAAKLFEVGQLEIDGESGLLKPSQNFDPLIVARAEKAVGRFDRGIVKDDIADRVLLSGGVFDTKDTTRVVGLELANEIYTDPVVNIVKRDIVRDDAINAIERLATANNVALPSDIKQRSLDELVTIGGALSTRDALKASVTGRQAEVFLPEIVIGEKGSAEVVKVSVTREAAVALNLPKDATDLTEEVFNDLLSRGIDPNLIIGGGVGDIDETGKVETETYDRGAVFTDPIKVDEGDKVEDFDKVEDYGRESFVGGLSEEFVGGDDDVLKVVGIKVENGQTYVAPVYEEPAIVSIDDGKDEATQAAQTVAEDDSDRAEERKIQYYQFSMAGQNLAITGSQYGDNADHWWTAYSSAGNSRNLLTHFSDNSVALTLNATGQDVTGENAMTISGTDRGQVGSVADILGQHSSSFQLALKAASYSAGSLAGSDNSTGTASLSTNNMEALQASSPYELCTSCDQLATGIWQSWSVAASTRGPGRQHQGHWAIGAPLDANTITQLMGMRATFGGGVYGTVSQAGTGTSETGFGEFSASVDFNNPTSRQTNYWQLESFSSDNFALPEKRAVTVQHGSEFGRYVGQGQGIVVDGGVHGTIGNLQTGGTFAINDTDGSDNYAISGSYAGTGVAR